MAVPVRCNIFCQQCVLVQATVRPKPGCHCEKPVSLQIAGFWNTYPAQTTKKIICVQMETAVVDCEFAHRILCFILQKQHGFME